jgi:hypothetical protein
VLEIIDLSGGENQKIGEMVSNLSGQPEKKYGRKAAIAAASFAALFLTTLIL